MCSAAFSHYTCSPNPLNTIGSSTLINHIGPEVGTSSNLLPSTQPMGSCDKGPIAKKRNLEGFFPVSSQNCQPLEGSVTSLLGSQTPEPILVWCESRDTFRSVNTRGLKCYQFSWPKTGNTWQLWRSRRPNPYISTSLIYSRNQKEEIVALSSNIVFTGMEGFISLFSRLTTSSRKISWKCDFCFII